MGDPDAWNKQHLVLVATVAHQTKVSTTCYLFLVEHYEKISIAGRCGSLPTKKADVTLITLDQSRIYKNRQRFTIPQMG